MKKNVLDLTVGKPEKLILTFSIPLFIGNFFQQIFIVADTMIVGHLIGDRALAAVGATQSIYFLLMTFLGGCSIGFSMIIARFFGAKDEEGVKKATGASVYLGTIMTLILTVGGMLMTTPFLNLLNTPADIFEYSQTYLLIMFATLGFTTAFRLISSVLQALGNTRIPLYILCISLLFNIVLSLWFVDPYGLNLGIAGAAWGTVLSQLLATVAGLVFIWKKIPELHLNWKHLKPERPLLKEIFQLATSIGFGNSIIQIGSVILQVPINSFGVYTITAFITARQVFGITFMPLMSIGNAVATFTSQNLGAKKDDRIPKGIFAGMKISIIWSTLMVIMAYTISGYIVELMSGTTNSQIIYESVLYLRLAIPFLYALSVLVIYKSFLSGLGKKLVPVITSIIELLGKVISTLWLIPHLGFVGVALTEPFIWVAAGGLLLIIVHKENLPFKLPKLKKA